MLLSASISHKSYSQQGDTTKILILNDIVIKENKPLSEMERMPAMKDNVIYAGKKTELIQMSQINADLSTNNTRQVFAKVPGMSIWENEGSGIQTGVATRGLSPNRSWEFNVRQNGYDISSEVFGYPETYYAPPMEAIGKIEVIRGAASLQFGPQFGGLLNYQIKKGISNKAFSFESQQTGGTYGLFNSFNAISENSKRVSYYGFYQHRTANGWRDNSQYNIYTGYISANFQITKDIILNTEYTRSDYKSQQPGGLTDVQYNVNHRQSSRERNWFGAPFNIVSITLIYSISRNINVQLKSFITIAERNSVGYTKAINIKDSINSTTLQYNSRQVDRDQYHNYGSEMRMSVKYNFFKNESILAGGMRIYSGNTIRNQLGKGTTGSNFDVSLTSQRYERSLVFQTINYAAFVENIFQIGKRLKVVPGIRFEYIENNVSGYLNTTPSGVLKSENRVRKLVLYGIGSELKVSENTNFYFNYSLAYRPVTFSELTPSATTEIIDPNLKDANGFNADFGYRGSIKNFLSFDIGVFYLQYDNRIGTIIQNGLLYKTNIGTSISKGLESFFELNIMKMITDKSKYGTISIFASNAFINAQYTKWSNPAILNDPDKTIEGKRVENAPKFIHRFGCTYNLKDFSTTMQISNVADVYTDASNTEMPNESATIGKLKGYKIIDISLSYKFMKRYNIKTGINNVSDEKYATRRAGGYPGPGILPGNGRTVFVSIGASF